MTNSLAGEAKMRDSLCYSYKEESIVFMRKEANGACILNSTRPHADLCVGKVRECTTANSQPDPHRRQTTQQHRLDEKYRINIGSTILDYNEFFHPD